MPQSQAYKLPFLKKEQVAKDTYSFYFDRSQSGVDFTAGQYTRMILPHENADDRGDRRYFTISSNPLIKAIQMHTTRIVAESSTFKKHLLNLAPGTVVDFFGPMGEFILPESTEQPIVFLAGGIGLTPYHSMMTYANEAQTGHTITLFVSFSTAEEVVYRDEMRAIEAENAKLKSIYTVTHPEASLSLWDGETGRISEDLLKKYISDLKAPLYYISGPGAMVGALQKTLEALGIPEAQIKEEQFPGY